MSDFASRWCMKCIFAAFKSGELKCSKKPFDVETDEQRDIVRWLQNGGFGRCPSFIKT